jgi:hypothetical protein
LPLSEKWFFSPEAVSLAKSISDEAAFPYRVELQLASPLRKSAKLSITLPHELKAYTIIYPRRVEPCSQSVSN